MTDEDLIEWLRDLAEVLGKVLGKEAFTRAADRIEELVKERDGYLAERNKFQLYLQRTHADLELEVAAVDALNAKLAKAVEALENLHHAVCGETGFASAVRHHSGKAYSWESLDIADEQTRIVLAELGGK